MTFAERLRKERKAAKLTQAELANKLGVTPTVIGQYERGVRNPKFDALRRIATALGIELSSLISVSNEFPGEVQFDFNKPVIFVDNDFRERFFTKKSEVIAGQLPPDVVMAVGEKGESNTIPLKNISIGEAVELYFNDDGKRKVVEYIRDLMKIAEYRKEETVVRPKNGEPE